MVFDTILLSQFGTLLQGDKALSAIVKALEQVLADSALVPDRAAVVRVAIEIIILQEAQLHTQRDVIKHLRETIAHLNQDISRLQVQKD